MNTLASMYWCLPPEIRISEDAIVSAAIDLSAEDEREIIDVEYEEISSSYGRLDSCSDN